MKKRVSLLMLPLMTVAAFAQNSGEQEQPPEVARYSVEMIIFSYQQDVSAGSEVFVADEPPPVDGDMFDEALVDETQFSVPAYSEEPAEEITDKLELSMMPEEDFTLINVIERLDRLEAYTPLMHFGWTQLTYPAEETEARPLSAFMPPPEGLEGEIKLYLSRYLHLGIKLQLDAPVANTPLQPLADRPYNSYNDGDDEEVVMVYPVRYRIEEVRIFRNGELRYYDHPKFGVLAKITRAESEEPAKDDVDDDTELLGDVDE